MTSKSKHDVISSSQDYLPWQTWTVHVEKLCSVSKSIILLLILALFIYSCQSKAQDSDVDNRLARLEEQLNKLSQKTEKRLADIERQTGSLSDLEKSIRPLQQVVDSLISKPSGAKDTQETSTFATQAELTTGIQNLLSLESWEYRVVKDGYSDNYAITIQLHNGFKKSIKLIDGSVRFKDLLGSDLFGIKVTPDLKIPPEKSITDKGQYHINQFMYEQNRMRTINKKDVAAELVIRKIVFDDNTILTF